MARLTGHIKLWNTVEHSVRLEPEKLSFNLALLSQPASQFKPSRTDLSFNGTITCSTKHEITFEPFMIEMSFELCLNHEISKTLSGAFTTIWADLRCMQSYDAETEACLLTGEEISTQLPQGIKHGKCVEKKKYNVKQVFLSLTMTMNQRGGNEIESLTAGTQKRSTRKASINLKTKSDLTLGYVLSYNRSYFAMNTTIFCLILMCVIVFLTKMLGNIVYIPNSKCHDRRFPDWSKLAWAWGSKCWGLCMFVCHSVCLYSAM